MVMEVLVRAPSPFPDCLPIEGGNVQNIGLSFTGLLEPFVYFDLINMCCINIYPLGVILLDSAELE